VKSESSDHRRSETVLIVDDDPICLNAMVRIVSKSFSVVTADGIFQAMARCSSHRFAAILCDFDMPCGDGLQVIASVRAMGHQVPAAIVTGSPTSENLDAALECGFIDEVLHKPFEVAALLSTVHRLVERSTSHSPNP
jgi:two-component system, OmpR family, response regulator QseB